MAEQIISNPLALSEDALGEDVEVVVVNTEGDYPFIGDFEAFNKLRKNSSY